MASKQEIVDYFEKLPVDAQQNLIDAHAEGVNFLCDRFNYVNHGLG